MVGLSPEVRAITGHDRLHELATPEGHRTGSTWQQVRAARKRTAQAIIEAKKFVDGTEGEFQRLDRTEKDFRLKVAVILFTVAMAKEPSESQYIQANQELRATVQSFMTNGTDAIVRDNSFRSEVRKFFDRILEDVGGAPCRYIKQFNLAFAHTTMKQGPQIEELPPIARAKHIAELLPFNDNRITERGGFLFDM